MNGVIHGRCSPTVVVLKSHDFMELYFLRARWLWGGDLMHWMVFEEKQMTKTLLLLMKINIAKNSVDKIFFIFFIGCCPRVAFQIDTSS